MADFIGIKDSAQPVINAPDTGAMITILNPKPGAAGQFDNRNLLISALLATLSNTWSALQGNPEDNTSLKAILDAIRDQILALQGGNAIKRQQFANQAAMLNWTQAVQGDMAIRSDDSNTVYIFSGADRTQAANWIPIELPSFSIDDVVDPVNKQNTYVITWDQANNKAVWSAAPAGSTTPFATLSEYNAAVANKAVDPALIKGIIDGKVDKETGKGLSTNDYTTLERNKLANLPTNPVESVSVNGGTPLTPDGNGNVNLTINPSGTGLTPEQIIRINNTPLIPQLYGAIGDGNSHPVQEWITAGLYANLAAIQVDYPHVVALTDEIDWAAIQKAINVAKAGIMVAEVYLPRGNYQINRELVMGSGVVLEGNSQEATRIRANNAAAAFVGTDMVQMHTGTTSYQHNQQIRRIHLEANGLVDYCIYTENINENGGLIDVKLTRYRVNGFRSQAAAGSPVGRPLNFFLDKVYCIGRQSTDASWTGTPSGAGIYLASGSGERISMRDITVAAYNQSVTDDTGLTNAAIVIAGGGFLTCEVASAHVEGCVHGVLVNRGYAKIGVLTGHSSVTNVCTVELRTAQNGGNAACEIAWINKANATNSVLVRRDSGNTTVPGNLPGRYEVNSSREGRLVSHLRQASDYDNSIAPTAGQAMVWDNTTQKWKPGTVSSGGGPANTDGLPEGTTNQYFTQARARAAITPSSEFTYVNGALGINQIAQSKITNLTADLAAKADLVAGKVPASQLPSYVDDVLEFANLAAFPVTGETGKIYVAIDTGIQYRWSGSSYVAFNASGGAQLATDTQFDNADNSTAAKPSQIINRLTGALASLATTAKNSLVAAINELHNRFANYETTTQLNSRDTANRNRANHTGTQEAGTITGLSTVATTGNYDDLTNKPTIPTAYTDEQAQDAVGAALNTDDFIYDDAQNRISLKTKPVNPFSETIRAQAAAATKWASVPGIGYVPVFDINDVQATGKRVLDLDFSQMDAGNVALNTVFNNNQGANVTFQLLGGAAQIVQLSNGRKGLRFTGTQYLQASDGVPFKLLHDGTKNYSIYAEYQAEGSGVRAIFGNNNYEYFRHGISLQVDGTDSVNFLVSNNTATAPTEHYLTGVVPQTGPESLWVQFRPIRKGGLTASRYRNEVRMYAGGTLRKMENRSANTAFSAANPSFPLQIGADGNGGNKFFGTLCRLVIFEEVTDASGRTVQETPAYTRKAASNSQFIDTTEMQQFTAKYYQGGFFSQNPITKKYIFITAFSQDHFGTPPAAIVLREKMDLYADWGNERTIFNFPDNSNSWYVPVGGHSSNGRLHLMMTRQNGASPDEIFYTYSDNDGLTWTTPVLVYTNATYPYILCHGKLRILADGTLLIPLYGSDYQDLGGGPTQTTGFVGVLRSTNNGASWSVVILTTSLFLNEGEVLPIGTQNVLYVVRMENSNNFQHWRSTNGGASWTLDGTLNFGSTFSFKHPPNLELHRIGGVDVAAIYLGNRNRLRFEAKYTRASDIVANGLAAWTGKTLFDVDTHWEGLGVSLGGYPSYHVYDGLKMLAVNYDEEPANDVTTLRFYRHGNLHEAQVKSELSIP